MITTKMRGLPKAKSKAALYTSIFRSVCFVMDLNWQIQEARDRRLVRMMNSENLTQENEDIETLQSKVKNQIRSILYNVAEVVDGKRPPKIG